MNGLRMPGSITNMVWTTAGFAWALGLVGLAACTIAPVPAEGLPVGSKNW